MVLCVFPVYFTQCSCHQSRVFTTDKGYIFYYQKQHCFVCCIIFYHDIHKVLLFSLQTWNGRIQEFITARKREQKLQTKLTPQISRTSEEDYLSKTDEVPIEEKISELPALIKKDSQSKMPSASSKDLLSLDVKVKSKFAGRCLSHESVFMYCEDVNPVSSLARSKSDEKMFIKGGSGNYLQDSLESKCVF